MLLTILIRFPALPNAVTLALRALLWAVALLAALALAVAVMVALLPVLPQLMMAGSLIAAYALATMPTTRKEVRHAR